MPKETIPGEEDSKSDSENHLNALENSFLHRVAAQAKIFSYYDVIRWVIDNVTIQKNTFVSSFESVLAPIKV